MRLTAVRRCYTWYRSKTRVDYPKHLALKDEVDSCNLKQVKAVTFSMDPFYPGKGNDSIRDVWNFIENPSKLETNPGCKLNHEMRNDRRPPNMQIKLVNGGKVIINTEYLPQMELMRIFNKYTVTDVPSATQRLLDKDEYLKVFKS